MDSAKNSSNLYKYATWKNVLARIFTYGWIGSQLMPYDETWIYHGTYNAKTLFLTFEGASVFNIHSVKI